MEAEFLGLFTDKIIIIIIIIFFLGRKASKLLWLERALNTRCTRYSLLLCYVQTSQTRTRWFYLLVAQQNVIDVLCRTPPPYRPVPQNEGGPCATRLHGARG